MRGERKMECNFESALEMVLEVEGGYVNHKKDKGGATNKGITLATLKRHNPKATITDLKIISNEMLRKIYYEDYWLKASCDKLPHGLDILVFDTAVNSGVYRAVIILQAICGVKQDGIIGKQTLAAIESFDKRLLLLQYFYDRVIFLKKISTYPVFGKGWRKRVCAVMLHVLEVMQ
jgi:lysozyme family protein